MHDWLRMDKSDIYVVEELKAPATKHHWQENIAVLLKGTMPTPEIVWHPQSIT